MNKRRMLAVIVVSMIMMVSAYSDGVGQLATSPWPMRGHDARHTGQSPYLGPQKAALAWSYTTGNTVYSSPAIGLDGTIYVGSYDNKVYALKPDGTLKWTYPTGDVVSSSPAIGSDGTIYVGSYDYKVYALKPDGTLKWSYTTGDGVSSSPAIGSDGTIYVGSWDNKVYALKPDGTLKWTYPTGDVVSPSPAIGLDGTIYVGSRDNKVYALKPDGTLKWSYTTGDDVRSSPAIGLDGTIYVGSYDNKVYAFTEEVPLWNVGIRVTRATGGSKITAGKIAIRAGDIAEFAAAVTDEEGNPVDESITWIVTGAAGTISSEGRFTASQKSGNTGSIIATAGSAADTVQVTVIPNLLKRIELSPASVELKPGDRVTFKAQGYDAYGNMITVRPLWHVAGDVGTISLITGTFVAKEAGEGYVVAYAQAVFGDASTEVSGSAKVVVRAVPEAYALYPNLPNPFNPSTTLRYALPKACIVHLAVYDVRGALLRVLVDGGKEAGTYSAMWDGRDEEGHPVSSGIYVVRLQVRTAFQEVRFSEARTMALVR